jgi:hypothetical protein
MLEAGEALIPSPQAPFAIPAKIHLYEEWLKTRVPQSGKKFEKVKVDEEFF